MSLREINAGDLSLLRQWKNEHRDAFFHKEEISVKDQDRWYHLYTEDINDHMFMIVEDKVTLGCMGIRIVDGKWDIYNVILGVPSLGGMGFMSRALAEMIDFAQSANPVPVRAKVLNVNPAAEWYGKNGFVVTEQNDEFCVMEYQ